MTNVIQKITNCFKKPKQILPIKEKDLFNFEHRWKLRDWINIEQLQWHGLSENPNAMYLLESNPHKISWYYLSENPSAIYLLEQNPDKINWDNLSENPSAIHLLKANPDKINWSQLSQNPSIFKIDYDFFRRRMNIIREELMEKTWHLSRFEEWCM